MAIGLLTRWLFTATVGAAQLRIVKGFQKATDLDRIMLMPLSQTSAAIAHILCDDCGRRPFRYSVVSCNTLACGTYSFLDAARFSRALIQPLPQSNAPIKTAIPHSTWLQPLPCS